MPTTTNYGWTTPTPAGDSGAWGSILNTAIQAIDTALKAVSDVAAAALAKAGGAMTGRVDMHTSTTKVVALGNVNGATALDITTGQYFTATLTGATTFTFDGAVPAAGLAFGVILKLTNAAAGVVWPSGTKWTDGDPTGTVNTDIYVLMTDDGGTTWHGSIVARGHA